MDDSSIAEAKMNGSRTVDSIQGPIQSSQTVASRLLRTGLHIGLVDLNDVGARGKEIFDFLIHRGRVVHRKLFFILVEVVLSLLRHRVRAGDGNFDRSICIAAEEFDVAYSDRILAANLSDDTRHRIRMSASIKRRSRILEINTFKRCGKPVGVTLTANLAVGDDVEPGTLLVPDRENRRIVLRFLQKFRRDTPQFLCSCAWRKTCGKLLAIDEPLRLKI